MKNLIILLFLTILTNLAYADNATDSLRNKELRRDLKFKGQYSDLKAEYGEFSQSELESSSPRVEEAEAPAEAPQNAKNIPSGLPSLPNIEGMTKEQATEMGRAIKKAQEAGIPSMPGLPK